MRRVLILVHEFPQISETYIKTEIERVKQDFDVSVVALTPANTPYVDHHPFELLRERSLQGVAALAHRYRPDILHGHYLHVAPFLRFMARQLGTFFTVRTHSFDILSAGWLDRKESIDSVNDPACRGVLAFPFLVDRLVKAGVDARKLVPCWPVVDLKKFRDREQNGDAVMNVGAALPKKAMEGFVDLATRCPSMKFDLYMMGYSAAEIETYARKAGSPVTIVPPIQPDDMPPEYKKHRWLLYTASKEVGTVGWPLSVAEAQASGVGVLIQNIRPDLAEFVGPGGYVFDTLDEARAIITQPFPEEKRELSFRHAEKSDIEGHIGLLYQLWS